MSNAASIRAFARWAPPNQRRYTATALAATTTLQRRLFSKPKADLLPGSESALKTASILPFTGSNTPYESHE